MIFFLLNLNFPFLVLCTLCFYYKVESIKQQQYTYLQNGERKKYKLVPSPFTLCLYLYFLWFH
uniref:Uncharacterized protein n=1 Tax=Anguilla anguilla TaxID=7936 RepID=A0A0E9XU13_ANGAN